VAIHPPSDIVLDVAKAADPAKLQAAALKLAGSADGTDAGFADLVDGLGGRGGSSRSTLAGEVAAPAIGVSARASRLDAASADPAMKPYRDFEAFVLQSFIAEMLPKDAQGIYGQGVAGEMWRGILAQQLGKEIARAGGIGIAKAISKAHPAAARRRPDPMAAASPGEASDASHAHDGRVAPATPTSGA
jgi:hypothetical protein